MAGFPGVAIGRFSSHFGIFGDEIFRKI